MSTENKSKYISVKKGSSEYIIQKEPLTSYTYPLARDARLIATSGDDCSAALNTEDYLINYGFLINSETGEMVIDEETGKESLNIVSEPSPDFYTPDDLCEKPFIESSSLKELLNDKNCIYPLGSNLNGYLLKSFFRNEDDNSNNSIYDKGYYQDVSPLCRKSDTIGRDPWTPAAKNRGFNFKVGANWLGCYSVSSTENSPRNGNKIDNVIIYDSTLKRCITPDDITSSDFNGYDSIDLGENLKRSILGYSYDRIHISGAMYGENGTTFTKTFSGLDAGYWCFSCYIKATLPSRYSYRIAKVYIPEGMESKIDIFSSEESSVLRPDSFKIKNYYTRIIVRVNVSENNSSWNLKLTLGGCTSNEPKSDVDIFGMCFSKGKCPVEIDYHSYPSFSPLVFYTTLLNMSNDWTVKYKRYLYGGADKWDYKDIVGGCEIPYPNFSLKSEKGYSTGEELITIVHHKDQNKVIYSSFCERDGYSEPVEINYVVRSPELRNEIFVGGTKPSILLGGYMFGASYEDDHLVNEGSFRSTPGIYRDLMIFDSALSDDDIKKVDNSLFAVSFTSSDYTIDEFHNGDSDDDGEKDDRSNSNSPSLLRGSFFMVDTLKEMTIGQNNSSGYMGISYP